MVSPVNTAATQQAIANPFQDLNKQQVKEQDGAKQAEKTQAVQTGGQGGDTDSKTTVQTASSGSETQQDTKKDRGSLVDISV